MCVSVRGGHVEVKSDQNCVRAGSFDVSVVLLVLFFFVQVVSNARGAL